MGPLQLENEEFWGSDRKRTRSAVLDPVFAEADPKCLIVDVPAKVRLDSKQSLPLLGYFVRSDKDERTLGFNRVALVVAVDLESGDVHVRPLFDRGRLRAETPGIKQPAVPWIKQITFFDPDLREALGLPWDPSRYSITVLARDYRSNRVEVVLEDPARFEDPAVAEFVAQQREALQVAPVFPPHPEPDEDGARPEFPTFAASEDTPEVPAEQGIVLAGARVSALGADSRCILRGSFRLPVLPHQVLRPDPTTALLPDVGDPAATAVVPITVVATGSVTRGPFVFRLQVPIYEPVDGPEVTGQFSVDLFAFAKPLPWRPQTCFLSAFNGPFVSEGPLAMAFVSPEMLRRG